MTRRRFTKLLMGRGLSRNQASLWAKRMRPGRSYDAELPYASFCAATSMLGTTAEKMALQVKRMCEAFYDPLTAVAREEAR